MKTHLASAGEATRLASISDQAHWLKSLGRVNWTVYASNPTATAYINPEPSVRTFVAWNPTAMPQLVSFDADDKPVGQSTVPPHALVGVQKLELPK